jgi:hypothetical protein
VTFVTDFISKLADKGVAGGKIMKKSFFLICLITLIPAFSYAATQIMSTSNQAVFNTAYTTASNGDFMLANKLGAQIVLFYYKRSPRVADPIITYETLRNAERLALRPIFFVNAYPNLTLLILTNILLILTITRRRQLEHATTTVIYSYAMR